MRFWRATVTGKFISKLYPSAKIVNSCLLGMSKKTGLNRFSDSDGSIWCQVSLFVTQDPYETIFKSSADLYSDYEICLAFLKIIPKSQL